MPMKFCKENDQLKFVLLYLYYLYCIGFNSIFWTTASSIGGRGFRPIGREQLEHWLPKVVAALKVTSAKIQT